MLRVQQRGVPLLRPLPGMAWATARIWAKKKGRKKPRDLTARLPVPSQDRATPSGSRREELNHSLYLCVQEGNVRAVQTILDEMQHFAIPPNQRTLWYALGACARTGDLATAESVLARALSAPDTEAVYDVHAMTLMMESAATAQAYSAVAGLWDQMKQRGLPPSRTAYGVAMRAAYLAGDTARVLDLWQEMQHVSIVPDFATFQAVFRASVEAHYYSDALTLLQTGETLGVPVYFKHYNQILLHCAQHQDARNVFALFLEQRQLGFRPNGSTFQALFAAALSAKSVALGFRVLKETRRSSIVPTKASYTLLIKLCNLPGAADMERALGVVRECAHYYGPRPDPEMLHVLLDIALAVPDPWFWHGIAAFRELLEQDDPVDPHTFDRVLGMCLATGQVRMALRLLRRVRATYGASFTPTATTMLRAATALAIAGRVDRSVEMLDQLQRVHGVQPDAAALTALLAGALATSGSAEASASASAAVDVSALVLKLISDYPGVGHNPDVTRSILQAVVPGAEWVRGSSAQLQTWLIQAFANDDLAQAKLLALARTRAMQHDWQELGQVVRQRMYQFGYEFEPVPRLVYSYR